MRFSDVIILIVCGAGVAFAFYLQNKWESAVIPSYNTPIAVRITQIMTGLLTALGAQVGVIVPFDMYEVWREPTWLGDGWQYHARGAQTPNALIDPQSLETYVKEINRRAAALNAPIRVSGVRPEGQSFVYDVVF